MDVPAPFDGVVKSVSVKVGDKISEGALILLMETSTAKHLLWLAQSQQLLPRPL